MPGTRGARVRPGHDRAAEREVPGAVSEAPAGGEEGWTGAVEVTLAVAVDTPD